LQEILLAGCALGALAALGVPAPAVLGVMAALGASVIASAPVTGAVA